VEARALAARKYDAFHDFGSPISEQRRAVHNKGDAWR
jgi:hypothetical protein